MPIDLKLVRMPGKNGGSRIANEMIANEGVVLRSNGWH
jgi:hypothetical protein